MKVLFWKPVNQVYWQPTPPILLVTLEADSHLHQDRPYGPVELKVLTSWICSEPVSQLLS